MLSELSTVYDEEVHWYIFTIDTRQATLDRIDKIKDPTQRQIAMNIAQRLEQRGMQQGIQQEKLHIARNMLAKLHLDIKTVAQATGPSARELMELQQEAKT